MPPARAEALAHLRLATGTAGLELDELVLAAEHDVVVGGLRLHYLDWGSAERPVLVFLHGGCLTAHTWDLVCLALRKEFHCLAVDLRGHGDSEWSPTVDYGPDAHSRDIRGLVDQLALDKPVLVGHSLGGLSAMTYAAEAQDQVGGIVMVDVGPEVQPRAVRRVAEFVTGDAEHASVEDFVNRACAFNPGRDPRLLRYSLRHNLRQLPDGAWTWKYDRRKLTPEYFAEVTRKLGQLRDAAACVTCPVLVVRGGKSDALSDAQAARFAAAFPNGRWAKVKEAGHTVQGDNPRGLAEALSDFLSEIGRQEVAG
jgi:pimeloyl-ACP methyl ester carboxylesterase